MSKELFSLLIQVIRSWQVLAVTGALIVYFLLVSSVTRGHKRPRSVARTTVASKGKAAPVGEPDVETTDSDDLGLEEE
ncbi:MAG: hypothetical protein LBT39_04495 [Treponema sp.]|nr:hypothetical protein [Treponema sp.]